MTYLSVKAKFYKKNQALAPLTLSEETLLIPSGLPPEDLKTWVRGSLRCKFMSYPYQVDLSKLEITLLDKSPNQRPGDPIVKFSTEKVRGE